MQRWLAGLGVVLSFSLGCGSDGDAESTTPKKDAGSDATGSGGSGGGGGSGGSDASQGAPNGTTCGSASECQSGFCADGVCCATACDGVCESCDQAAAVGTCTPHGPGTDPEADCAAKGDGSALCAGVCDGQSGCLFPAAETTCGASSCTAGTVTAQVCDGAGSCVGAATDCGLYACNASACNTSCSTDTDCSNVAYCDAGACVAKKDNGGACTSATQCKSGLCEGGYCCGGACAAPASCQSGACLCGGSACTGGATCITWYFDKDGDAHAASSQLDAVACSNQSPGIGYFATADDCYDDNKLAYPGQTQFFTFHRGDGSYDYDCSGSEEQRYQTLLPFSTCIDCGAKQPISGACDACPSVIGGVTQYNLGYGCTGAPGCSGVAAREGFKIFTACGQTGTLWACSQTSCNLSAETSSQVVQGCH